MSFLINPFFVAAGSVTPITYTPFRWYDSSFYSLADGAPITAAMPWEDQSTNASDATTTVGQEPEFRTAIFGALPAVRLQTTSHLVFDSGFFNLTDFTIINVARINGDSIWLSRNGQNRQIRASRSGVNNYSFNPGSGVEIISGVLAVAASDARMNVWRRNGGAVDFFENDTLVAGGSNGFVIDLDQIGLIDGGPLNIDIGEMVIYTSALTDQNIQDLYDDYFQPKFSLP